MNSNLEFYGFAIYLISLVSFVGVLVFAYVPSHYFDAIGITYYPSKVWCITLPTYLMVVLLSEVVFHFGYMLLVTPAPTCIYAFTEKARNEVFSYNVANDNTGVNVFFCKDKPSIPPIQDISLSKYNHHAYGAL